MPASHPADGRRCDGVGSIRIKVGHVDGGYEADAVGAKWVSCGYQGSSVSALPERRLREVNAAILDAERGSILGRAC